LVFLRRDTVLDLVIEKAPELLDNIDELNKKEKEKKLNERNDITIEQINNIVQWDKKNKKLRDIEFRFMLELAEGRKPLSERNKFIAGLNLQKVKKLGFNE